VTFHDTLPRRGPTQPTIGLGVISGYGATMPPMFVPVKAADHPLPTCGTSSSGSAERAQTLVPMARLAAAAAGCSGREADESRIGTGIEAYHEHRHLKPSALVEESPVAARLCRLGTSGTMGMQGSNRKATAKARRPSPAGIRHVVP
jgi:hypothetical protein